MGTLTDQIKDMREADEDLLASLLSTDPTERHRATCLILRRMSRVIESVGGSMSELVAGYNQLRMDVQAIKTSVDSDIAAIKSAPPQVQPTWERVLRLVKWPVSVPLTTGIICLTLRPQLAGLVSSIIKMFT